MKLGVILSSVVNLEDLDISFKEETVESNGGIVAVKTGVINDKEVAFIYRSSGKKYTAHNINFKANILALSEIGVTHIISSAVSGSLSPHINKEDFVLLDQFLDFTKRSQHTRFEQGDFSFVDMTDPYCLYLRSLFIQTAKENNIQIHETGCYVGVDGPRFETRAEIKMYGLLGGNVIGHTNVQETIIAREYGISMATIAYVSNKGAGLQDEHVTRIANAISVEENKNKIVTLFKGVINSYTKSNEENIKSYLPEIEIIHADE